MNVILFRAIMLNVVVPPTRADSSLTRKDQTVHYILMPKRSYVPKSFIILLKATPNPGFSSAMPAVAAFSPSVNVTKLFCRNDLEFVLVKFIFG